MVQNQLQSAEIISTSHIFARLDGESSQAPRDTSKLGGPGLQRVKSMVFLQIAQFVWHQFWDDYDWLRSWSLWEFVKVDIWFCMNVILFDKRRLMLFEPPSLTVLQPEPRSKSNAKPMETWKMNWQQKLKLYIEDGKISRNVVLPKFGFNWSSTTNQTCTIHVHILYTVIDRFRWYQRFGRPSDPVKRPSRPGRRRNWTRDVCFHAVEKTPFQLVQTCFGRCMI